MERFHPDDVEEIVLARGDNPTSPSLQSTDALIAGPLARLRDAPLRRRNTRGSRLLPLAVDLALTSCGILAIDGTLARRLFPPLVLLGLLHAKSGGQNASLLDLPRDRALLALILAVGAALGFTEQAIMLAALVLLVANVAQSAASRG
jgi:hypothetical protein